jgi:glucose-6-phosphate dehydrogenase assembly protein OpcA
MIETLTDTNSAKISSALLKVRRSAGSPAMGMVLTLIVVCDESEYEPAMKAGMQASREHPSRILLVVTGQGRNSSLNAEVRIGEGTPGEVVIVRMRGAVAAHPASVIRPLLLPDSPVVIWWPGKSPANIAEDELAHLAGRRLTDASTAGRPLAALRTRAETYRPGDTDLSWTRTTPWRALLAAALDQYPSKIKSILIEAERNNPSADLLSAWLGSRLKLNVKRRVSDGPGITAARLGTAAGDIAITRPDGLLASYAVPGQPERLVALKRRDLTDLISEDLRRMDPDGVYEATVKTLASQPKAKKATRKPPTKSVTAKKATAKRPASKKSAAKRGGARVSSGRSRG